MFGACAMCMMQDETLENAIDVYVDEEFFPEWESENGIVSYSIDKIDYDKKTVCIDGVEYPLKDCDFPTVDPENPYELNEDEWKLVEHLKKAFMNCWKWAWCPWPAIPAAGRCAAMCAI